MQRIRSMLDSRAQEIEGRWTKNHKEPVSSDKEIRKIHTTRSFARSFQVEAAHDSDIVVSSKVVHGSAKGYIGTDWDNTHQVMEGMGGSITWYADWALGHKEEVKDEIFDHVFTKLQPSIIRIRNYHKNGIDDQGEEKDGNTKYGYQKSIDLMRETEKVISEGRKRLQGYLDFDILMCSWSPPTSLKQNGKLVGTKTNEPFGSEARDRALDQDTLTKDHRMVFNYRKFAMWWTDSLIEYKRQVGISPKWVSIQNEPDWSTEHHPVCLFEPSESFFRPGYYRAFDMCYDFFNSKLPEDVEVPEMISPEATGFDNFSVKGNELKPHWYSGSPRVAAIGNHLYDAGITHDDPAFFKKLDVTLKNTNKEAQDREVKKVFMTEYANLRNHKGHGSIDPLVTAMTIYNTLAVANSAMYLHWDLLWGRSNEGSLLVVDNPSKGFSGRGYELTHSFYWFRHFCLIRPYMQRLGTKDQGREIRGVKPLVFQSKTSAASTALLINTTQKWARVQMGYLPNEMAGHPRKVYYSTLVEKFTLAGDFPNANQTINLKPLSITSIVSGPHAPTD